MAFLEWEEKYRCGIASIDDDHRMLFDIVNALHDEVERGALHRHVAATITALIDYVDMHFAREERYLEMYGYPALESHKRQHKKLRQKVYAIKQIYDIEPDRLDTDKVLNFLKSWLTSHILNTDHQYIPFLRNSKIRTLAAVQEVEVRVPASKVPLIHTCAEALVDGGRLGKALEDILRKINKAQKIDVSPETANEFRKQLNID
jgi:hemerythrin